MAKVGMNLGDFSGLASDYASYRPGYAASVVSLVYALLGKAPSQVDVADVGAGTGIWTRMLAAHLPHSIVAIEPNDAMREQGVLTSTETAIQWQKGSGTATGLSDASVNLVTMASSFHWVDFEAGCREFQRILRPGGRFVAAWNPRLIEANPLLVEIESEISRLKPGINRVSSGRSGVTNGLTERLWATTGFDDVIYCEGRHTVEQTPAEYLGAWRSVNDLQVQLGPDLFQRYLAFIEEKIATLASIPTTYLTRAWAARRI